MLNQIEAAQSSDNFDPKLAGIIIFSAGAREGLLKEIMKDGAFGKKCVEYMTKKVGHALVKRYGQTMTTKLVEKMCDKGSEEAIVTALRDLIKGYTGGKKMTLEEAAQHVVEETIKKMRVTSVIGALEKQLDKLSGTALQRIAAGAIKGVKVEGAAAEKKLRELVDSAAGKIIEKFLMDNAGEPDKLENLSDEVTKRLLSDASFKASVQKIAAQKR